MANYNIDAIYNGSTSLPGTERIRIDGAGNVGINQSSPAYKLDVNGTARIANDMLATGNITIGKAAAYLILDGTNSDAEIYWRANSSNRWAAGMNVGDATENFNIYNYTTATTNFTILKANGNVGIGSTAPNDKLDVVGRVYAYRYIAVSSNASSPAYATDTSTGMYNAGTNIIGFSISGTEKLRIDSNGNVGIGTTSPVTQLHVSGSLQIGNGTNYGNKFTLFDDFSSGKLAFVMRDLNADDIFGLYCNSTTGEVRLLADDDNGTAFMTFQMNASERMRITNGGNVGIGTTSPSSLLHVYGATPTIKVQGSSTNSAKVDLIGTYTTWSLENQYVNGATNDMFRIYNSSLSADAITINRSTNNVGIGTTSPAAKLDVIGSIRYSSNGNPVTEYAGIITTPDDYPTCTEKARIYTIGTINADGNSSSYLEVEVIGSHRGYVIGSYYEYKRWIITVGDRISSRLVFSSGVNFIGLWNGTDATGFKGQNGAPDLANGAVIKLIANPNCGAGFFYTVRVKYANLNLTQGPFTYTNHSVYSVAIPSSQYHLYEDTVVLASNSGNVGIGTISPTNKLHVYSSANQPILIQGTTAGTWMDFQSSTSNLLSIGADGTRGIGFYNRTTSADLMTISNGGNVGIGTTSPAYKLDIVNAATTTLRIQNSLNTSDAYLITQNTLGSTFFGINATGGYIYNFSAIPILFYTNGSERMRIAGDGNVGIGTTSPGAKLVVQGGSTTDAVLLADKQTTGDGRVATFVNTNASGYSSYIYIGSSPGTDWKLGKNVTNVASNADFNITDHNNNNRFHIKSADGNVGIGTTSPTQVLHISSTNSGNNGLTISTTSATGNPQVRFLNSAGSERAAITYVSSADGVYFYTAASNSNLLNFIGSNVGIGTTSPAYKLEVIGDARVSGGIVNGGLSAQWTLSGGGTALFNGYIFWSNRIIAIPVERTEFGADGYIDITCPTSGTITYYNSSNVTTTVTCDANGIPTSAWESLYYEVTPGQSAASDPTKFRLVNYQNSTWRPSSNWLLICTRNGDGNFIKWIPGQVIIPNGGAFDSSNSTNNWQIAGTTNYVPKFTAANKIGNSAIYDSSGNIGIGTTSPFGTAANRTVLSVNGTTDVSLNIGSGGSQRAYLYGVSTYAELGTIGSLPLRFAPNNSEKMRINVDGNVGIGTSNPISLLQIAGTTSMFPTYDSITGYSYFLRMGYDTSGSYDYTIKRNGTTGFLEFNGTQGSPYVSYVFAGGDVYSGASGGTVGGFYFNSSSHGIRRATGTNDVYCFTTSGTLYLGAGGSSTTHVRVLSGGDVGIGVSPSYKLDVNGNIHGTGFPTSSDVRFKKNITPLQNSLEKIKKLQGVKYEWNEFVNSRRDGYKLNIPIIGLIAQDVEQVVPEIVDHWKLSDDCQDARSIDYPRLIPLLIEAIKEQQNQIEELRNEIKSLKSN